MKFGENISKTTEFSYYFERLHVLLVGQECAHEGVKKKSRVLQELLQMYPMKFIFLSLFLKNHELCCYNQDSHIIHVLFTAVPI